MPRQPISLTIKQPYVFVLICAVSTGILFFLGWVIIKSVFEHTGSPEFCGGCHTMQPMINAFRNDTHGGNSRTGVAAECVDCHLPHNGKLQYVIAKTYYGLHDAWAQISYDLSAINWAGKRLHREGFTYDSGCLTCHKELERASLPNPKAFVAHKPYFMGEIESQCVSCHEHVGHKNLIEHLARSQEEAAP